MMASLLRRLNTGKNRMKKYRKPSSFPTEIMDVMKKIRDCARVPKPVLARKSSLPAFFRKELRAGMTVEASVVLPLCICFLINLSGAIEMIRLHNNLQFALWNTGSRIAMLACEEEYPIPSLLTQLFVRGCITDCLGEEYLDQSPLTYGSNGLLLLESNLSGEENELDFVITYRTDSLIPLLGFPSFRMANRCCVRMWNGYEITPQEQTELVYVTEQGEVYHRSRECTYLRLSVRETLRERLESERNRQGSRYAACEKCAHGNMPAILYLTDEGDCYHYCRDCPGLKRTVTAIAKEAAGGYRPCSRCGNQ